MTRVPHVVIVGGGITGLSAAHHLIARGGGEAPHVTLVEQDARLGGKIRTIPIGGHALDVGPEALLTRQPAALALCREVGLGDDLVAPAAGDAYVWLDRLRPLPPGLLAGAPGGALPVIRSGTLSPAGLLRAGLDLVVPGRPPATDVSIGELVRHRLGDQVLERLIDPLLGGIHAGRCDELSVRATAPQLELALQRRRSLVRGLRALAAGAPAAGGPPFMTLRGGLVRLVDALEAHLAPLDVVLDAPVAAVVPRQGGGARVVLPGGDALDADHVVLATPTHVTAALLADTAPGAARELAAIDHASVATIALAYAAGDVVTTPGASGLLVPPSRPRTITAATWASAKWAHLAGGDTVLVKCSVGGSGRADVLDLPDDELLERVRADLRDAAGITGTPLETAITRFPQALPQYRVGHNERVARIDAALAAHPGLHLAGAGYRGVGVAACIRDGAVTAERIIESLAAPAGIHTRAA